MKSKRPSKSSLKRGKQLREEYELIAIVCEGTKTEPFYYDDVKKVERLPSANIFVTGDCGSDPLSVVKHGIHLYEKSVAEKNPSTLYDIVFCVIDRDAHQTFTAAVDYALQYNRNNNKAIIFPIKSYPSFEIWYLFHFLYTRQVFVKTPTKSAGQRCKEALNIEWKKIFKEDYEKSHSDIYKKLKSKNLIVEGIKNATLALADAKKTDEMNPSTEAHLLLEFLLNIVDQKFGIKNILDNIYEISEEIENNLIIKQDNIDKYLELLDSYLSRIDSALQLLKASLAKEKITINKTRLKFMISYLNELSTRINIAKSDITE